MNPRDPADADAARRYEVSESALDALRGPLAAILGHSQILERRILQGMRLLSPDDYLGRLAAIERSVWEMERQLQALQQEPVREP
jgi:signal transduction histidine kinase